MFELTGGSEAQCMAHRIIIIWRNQIGKLTDWRSTMRAKIGCGFLRLKAVEAQRVCVLAPNLRGGIVVPGIRAGWQGACPANESAKTVTNQSNACQHGNLKVTVRSCAMNFGNPSHKHGLQIVSPPQDPSLSRVHNANKA
jgi:hypothetical protein